MRLKLKITFYLVVVFFIHIPAHSSEHEAFRLYQEITTGQKKFEHLSPEQQHQVMIIQRLMNRSKCDGCTDDCRDAKERAENIRSSLDGYSKQLYRFVESNDLTDDCSTEFRRVKSSQSDFESATSDVRNYCN